MDRVNIEFLSDLAAKIIQAAADGTDLPQDDPDATGQYVLSVIALAAELIPVVGPPLSALCNLLGAVLFQPDTIGNIWTALKDRIEQAIDVKIADYHLQTLKDKVQGFKDNMDLYTRFLNDFEAATTPSEKAAAADSLKMAHIGFLSVIIAGIPEFQDAAYAASSLPLFALVANMHLMLLADGVKKGTNWGYTDSNIQSFKAQFMAKTSTAGGPPAPSIPSHGMWPASHLEAAIEKGPVAGVPEATLATWKQAHATIYTPTLAAAKGAADLDYCSYAWNTYHDGRKGIKIADGVDYDGYLVANYYKALSDYDTCMIVHVLNYVELWPYLLGDVWSTDTTRYVDREIFYGPYGRWSDNATWDPSKVPPVTWRGDHITTIQIRAHDDVDAFQIQHGTKWEDVQGSTTGEAFESMSLAADEWVTSVKIKYGYKLGRLTFTTNKGNQLEKGNARHADQEVTVAPAGYELTSVRVTRWVPHIPPGCEGIILGFRPLATDTTRPDTSHEEDSFKVMQANHLSKHDSAIQT